MENSAQMLLSKTTILCRTDKLITFLGAERREQWWFKDFYLKRKRKTYLESTFIHFRTQGFVMYPTFFIFYYALKLSKQVAKLSLVELNKILPWQ